MSLRTCSAPKSPVVLFCCIGINNVILQDAINDFIRQNKGLKVCNVCYKGDALIGHIKDLDDFDYGTIIIKKVVS